MKIIKILLFLYLSLFNVLSAQNSTVKIEETALEKDTKKELPFIKVSDVPENLASMSVKLKKIQQSIKEEDKIKEIHELIKPYNDSILVLLKNENYQNIKDQNIRELQKMQSELAVYLEQLKRWDVALKSQIEIYDQNSELLKKHFLLWNQTHTNATDNDAPKSILDSINSILKNLKELTSNLKTKYDKTLTDSQITTTKILTLLELDASLKENELLIKNQVFSQNMNPLFELLLEKSFSFSSFIDAIKNIGVEKYHEVLGYFQTNIKLFYIFISAIFFNMLFVLYINYLYRKRKLFVNDESYSKKAFYFILKPFSTFIILLALSIVAIYSNKPDSVVEVVLIIVLIPVVRIFLLVIKKEYFNYMYIFMFIYFIFSIYENAIESELESRILLLILNITLLLSIVFAIFKKIFNLLYNTTLKKTLNYLSILFVLLLTISTVANIYGSVLLSVRIIDGVLTTIYSSVIFYVLYVVLTGYVVILFRKRMSTASNMLEKYSNNIENTIKFLIKISIFLWWLIVLVKFLGLYPFLIDFKNHTLALSWEVSNTTISVQSIFDFSLIIFVTWVSARFIKTLLEVELFARFKFPRGVPTAILTTINYIVVISGTIIAFSSLGVSAQQFALIFGALGVGIGFGLRNIIANFVSGIIMVFERPIQIGDTIEVNNTMGSVLSIGARSSTIETFDGAEVIIPNADFIAKEITNWTLSDERRRKTFEFKVGLDNDVQEVLKIMQDVVLSNKDVLKDPEPLMTFKGFGEYYMEFKLYYWLSQNLIGAQSDVAIAIHEALKEANIKMPIPKTHINGGL